MLRLLVLPGLSATLASASGGVVRDEAFLLQQSLEEHPNVETFNTVMRSWLDGYYSIVRSKGDILLSKCCDLHRETGIDPWVSWGTATEEQQKIWEDTNCNAIVGSAEEDVGIGALNCAQKTFESFLRRNPIGVALHRSEEDEGCDDIDRESIDDVYFDRETVPVPLTIQCNTDFVVYDGKVNYARLGNCSKSVLKISDSCAGCYTNFVKNIGGTESTPGCISACYKLSYCSNKQPCDKKAKVCAACVQPALLEYDRCVGGTIHSGFTIDNFFNTFVRYAAH